MDVKWIALISTILLALIGYVVTYYNSLRLARRRERLDLINKQINEFYGPLFIACEAGEIAFHALREKLGGKNIFANRFSPQEDDERYKEWRIWLVNVLMPLNDYREKIILDKAHLIREEEMPVCLLRFIAHVASYKAVIQKWTQGDFSEHLSIIDFPVEIHAYIKDSYRELKHEQTVLIGRKSNNAN